MEDIKEKEITITNLQAKNIAPRVGQTFKAFTVYQIYGNDGNIYETGVKEFFEERKIGEVLNIKYTVTSKTSGGKVYTSYKIVLPSKEGIQLELIKKELFYKLNIMEKNIIAAIKLSCGEPVIKGPADVPAAPKVEAAKPEIAVETAEPADEIGDLFNAAEEPEY